VSSPLNFHLEHYDGPLDLLLDFDPEAGDQHLRIPIAKIYSAIPGVRQQATEMNIELSAEFVYMAATLIHIKSRMLLFLPKDPELEKISPEEDPRKELVDRLLEHERLKTAAEMLQQKRVVEEAVWSNRRWSSFLRTATTPAWPSTLHDLLSRRPAGAGAGEDQADYEVTGEDVSVPDMIRYLPGRYSTKKRCLAGAGSCLNGREPQGLICLFLAMLELVKLQAIGLVQADSFGEIGVKRLKGFDTAFASGEAISAIEEGYN